MKIIALIILGIYLNTTAAQTPLGTEFSYQGELKNSIGNPHDGSFDFQFEAFDTSTENTGASLGFFTIQDVQVTDGIFSTQIDFGGAAFIGDKVWLEISVRDGASTGVYTQLLPRQQVTATPYATHAQFVGADAISGIEIQDGSISSTELASNSVTTIKIANDSITDIKLADNSVTTNKIDTLAVTLDKMANGSVDSQRVVNGSLKAVDIDNTEIQQRINGNCIFPEYLTSISQAGNVVCARMPIGAANILDSTDDIGQKNTSIAIGVDNNPIVSYYDSSNGDLKIVKCSNSSCSVFNTPVTLDSAGDVGRYTSIAIGADNNPIIGYSNSSNGDLQVVKCSNPSCSTFNPPETLDSAGNVGGFTSIAIGTDNNPIISYYDWDNGNLKIVKCNNPSCSITNTPETLDSAGDVGQHTSIAIGADNNPIISYYDSSNNDLKIVKCSNPSCSATNTPIILDSAGFVGIFTSIAIGADGNPIISYIDADNSDVKIVKCINQSCSAFNTPVALDSAGGIGFFTSIAIGADNNPIISYYDVNLGDLKIVKCSNQSCSAINTPVTLDSAGFVGRFTSIAIGADNNPIISYYDDTNGDLKVYSCGDQACQN